MKSSFWPDGLSADPVEGLVAGLVAGLLALPVEGFDVPTDGLSAVPVEGLVVGFAAAAGLSTVVLGFTFVFIDGFSAGFLAGVEGLATVDLLLLPDDGLVCEPDVVLVDCVELEDLVCED